MWSSGSYKHGIEECAWGFLLLFFKSNAISELQGLTAVLVLLGDVFTMWINQCYELGPWGFGNVIGFRWHFASQSAKQRNVDTAEQFQLFPLTPSSLPGCTSLFPFSYLSFLLWLCKTNFWSPFLSLVPALVLLLPGLSSECIILGMLCLVVFFFFSNAHFCHFGYDLVFRYLLALLKCVWMLLKGAIFR